MARHSSAALKPYLVLTVDQRASRQEADAVPALLDALRTPPLPTAPVLAFQRTVGDEVQGVVGDPVSCVEAVARVLRASHWYVGIGVGTLEQPLPTETRAGRGPAYVRAREAVTRAKTAPHRIAVVGGRDHPGAWRLETVLGLWAGVLERRSANGWQVHDLLAEGLTYAEVGARLGISQSAVSQRAQAAGLVDEGRARELAVDLCATLLDGSGATGPQGAPGK